MRFYLTIRLSIFLLCGITYLSISYWQVRQSLAIEMADSDEEKTNPSETEEVEVKEAFEAVIHASDYSHIYFNTSLNHLCSHKPKWLKLFVHEIATPPPEA